MLLLVYAYRHDVGLIKQYVRSHEHGVCEKPCVYVVGMLCAFVLELRHARKLAEHGKAVKHPRHFGVCGNVRLHVKGVLLRVKTARHIKRQCFICAAAQVGGDLSHRYCVLIDHAVKAFVLLGEFRKILDGAEVVTDSQVSAWLNAGKTNFLFVKHNKIYLPFVF